MISQKVGKQTNVMLNPANGGTSNKTRAGFISVSKTYETLKRVQGDKQGVLFYEFIKAYLG
jgi:hypothetical protein